jgi:ADP-dependent NAD(P)H-hydrate dehydratase / NAD(P)H-hydrate epimerase
MKLLNNSQMRISDAYTCERLAIQSSMLMDRAAEACTNEILKRIDNSKSVCIICGPGDNGGDGFSIAIKLKHRGFNVSVIEIESDNCSENQSHYKSIYLSDNGSLVYFKSKTSIDNADIVVDAIFGSGLSRPVEGIYAELIHAINECKSFVISIDSPSGFLTENEMPPDYIAVKANWTLCFHCPKLMYFFKESVEYVGEWTVLDIGIITPNSEEFKSSEFPFYYTIDRDLNDELKRRSVFDHKGVFGNALIVAGSEGKMGAATLCVKACVKSGAGKTTAFIPASALSIMQISVPEAMCILSDEPTLLAGSINPEFADVVCFGPGAGQASETAMLLKLLIQQTSNPLLIDADGINILSENLTWLAFLPALTILTPHAIELDRLVGKSNTSFERFEKARALSQKFNLIIVLKGAYSAIILPNTNVYFNSTGNPGMAKGGSGDVLSGIITALLSQGLSPETACKLGVFIHGLAGDIAAESNSEIAMTPSDLIDELGSAFKLLMQ